MTFIARFRAQGSAADGGVGIRGAARLARVKLMTLLPEALQGVALFGGDVRVLAEHEPAPLLSHLPPR